VIKLTEAASIKVKQLMSKEEQYAGLRPMVQGGGCSGFKYKLEFTDGNGDFRIFESHGIKIFVDPKSLLYLMGTEIDFEDSLSGAGFRFINPSAKRTCGCGESFSF
tara:strand:- start:485 stop:802 length:318 start_codon:yes stop_codon:yes gene_type:complete